MGARLIYIKAANPNTALVAPTAIVCGILWVKFANVWFFGQSVTGAYTTVGG